MPKEYNRRGSIQEQLAAQLTDETPEETIEIDQIDEDADGHDDRNGQFVDGNQEAANPEPEIEELADEPTEETSVSDS